MQPCQACLCQLGSRKSHSSSVIIADDLIFVCNLKITVAATKSDVPSSTQRLSTT